MNCAPGLSPKTLNFVVRQGRKDIHHIVIDNLHEQRIQQLRRADVKVDSVFYTSSLPSVKWESDGWVNALCGDVETRTTYFDSSGKPVTEAASLGRYGVMLELIPEGADVIRRYVTLFRAEKRPDWGDVPRLSVKLPASLAVSSKVVEEQAATINEFVQTLVRDGFSGSSANAEVLAALHETQAGDDTLRGRKRPAASAAEWWFAIRKKHGLVQHRYLADLPGDYETQPDKAWPVVIFLHGSGEKGDDLEKVRRNGPPQMVKAGREFPFILISPQCDSGAWWQPAEVIDLLGEVKQKYKVDDQRVYLTGLSMGGYGAWTTATHFPKHFAAVAPVCGGGDPRDADLMADVPVWAFHGTKDQAVNSTKSIEMVDAIKAAGGDPKLTLYKGVGHNAWDKAYAGNALYEWFFENAFKQ